MFIFPCPISIKYRKEKWPDQGVKMFLPEQNFDQTPDANFLVTRIQTTLFDLGFPIDKCQKNAVAFAAQKLLATAPFLLVKKEKTNLASSFFDFPAKARDHLAFLAPFGMTGEKWGKFLLAHPQHFYMRPERLESKFNALQNWLSVYDIDGETLVRVLPNHHQLLGQKIDTLKAKFKANLKWLSPYGVDAGTWARAVLQQPSLFFQKPATLRTWFEVSLLLAESPYLYVLQDIPGQDFRPFRVARVLRSRYHSLSNLLLRLAVTEIVKPEPFPLLKRDRESLEKSLVAKLGHDPAEKEIPCHGTKKPSDHYASKSDSLQKALGNYVKSLTTALRTCPVPDKPRPINGSIAKVLVPEGNQVSQNSARLLLNRLVQAKVLTGFHLAS